MLTYRITTDLRGDDDVEDEMFRRLTDVGLATVAGVRPRDGLWRLIFCLSCDCGRCANFEDLVRAQNFVEAALLKQELEFELLEAEMVDNDD